MPGQLPQPSQPQKTAEPVGAGATGLSGDQCVGPGESRGVQSGPPSAAGKPIPSRGPRGNCGETESAPVVQYVHGWGSDPRPFQQLSPHCFLSHPDRPLWQLLYESDQRGRGRGDGDGGVERVGALRHWVVDPGRGGQRKKGKGVGSYWADHNCGMASTAVARRCAQAQPRPCAPP